MDYFVQAIKQALQLMIKDFDYPVLLLLSFKKCIIPNCKRIIALPLALCLVTGCLAQSIRILSSKPIDDNRIISPVIGFHNNHYYYVIDRPVKRQLVRDDGNSQTIIKQNKKKKLNLSASVVVPNNAKVPSYLYAFTASRKKSQRFIIYKKLQEQYGDAEVLSTKKFSKVLLRNSKNYFRKLNIQAVATLGSKFLLGIAPVKKKDKYNYLVTTKIEHEPGVKLHLSRPFDLKFQRLALYDKGQPLLLTGLVYVPVKNILFFTAVKRSADKPESFLGCIDDFSSKNINLFGPSPKWIINLTKKDLAFEKRIVEDICFKSLNQNKVVLTIIANNDHAGARRFDIEVTL